MKIYSNGLPNASHPAFINKIFLLKQPDLLQSFLQITIETILWWELLVLEYNQKQLRVLYVNCSFLSTWMVYYPLQGSNSRSLKNSFLHCNVTPFPNFSCYQYNVMELDNVSLCIFNSRDHKLPFLLQLESVNIRNTQLLNINSTFTQIQYY